MTRPVTRVIRLTTPLDLAGTLRPIAAEQFVVNLISLCIFPFAARPLLCAALKLDAAGFQRLIGERRTALPRFFLDALRP